MRALPAAALAATATFALTASLPAATFTYDVVVADSYDAVTGVVGRPTYDLPITGSTGTVTIELDETRFEAGDPIPPLGSDLTGLFGASASIGVLTAALDPAIATIVGIPGGVLFLNAFDAPIAVNVRTSVTDAALSGFFSVLAPTSGAPTTLTEVLGTLGNPDAQAIFAFNGTVNGGLDQVGLTAVGTLASTSIPPVPVPLPAGGLLLLTGLGAWTIGRRRPR